MYAPFARVLVPIDFSEHSLRALKLADNLVRGANGSVHLVHVVEENPWTFYAAQGVLGEGSVYPAPNGLALQLDTIKAAMVKELAALAPTVRNAPCTYEVRSGHAVDEILLCAGEQDASMIVICTHGRTGLAHLTMGSVAERVVRYSGVPVLSTRFDLPGD
jgi:universal stress protein A